MPFDTQIRVRYAETDRMGVVYHSNYLIFFEQARTEFLRVAGCRYRDIEEQGFVLAVLDCGLTFHRPALYDDLVTVKVWTAELRKLGMTLRYEIWRDADLLVSGHTSHAVLDKATFRPVRPPRELMDALQRTLEAS